MDDCVTSSGIGGIAGINSINDGKTMCVEMRGVRAAKPSAHSHSACVPMCCVCVLCMAANMGLVGVCASVLLTTTSHPI